MGLKLGQNINFRFFFLGFSAFLVAAKLSGCDSLLGRDIGRDILSGCDILPVTTYFLVATYFLSRHTF